MVEQLSKDVIVNEQKEDMVSKKLGERQEKPTKEELGVNKKILRCTHKCMTLWKRRTT